MKQLEDTLGSADKRLRESEQAAQDSWRLVSEEIVEKLEKAMGTRGGNPERTVDQPRGAREVVDNPTSTKALEAIVGRIEEISIAREPVWRSAVGPLVGILLGSAVVYGLRLVL